MKIVYLADASSIHTVRWVQHFTEKGWEVNLLSFSHPDAEIKNVKMYKLPSSFLKKMDYLVMIPYIRRIVKRIQPDIVHAHYLTSYGGIAGRIGFNPIILSAWGSDVLISLRERGVYSSFLRWFVSPALKRAVNINVVSEGLRDVLVHRLGVEKHRICVIPNGTDTSIFHPDYECTQEYWRKNLRILDGHKVILSPRQVKPIYNIETIIKAIPYVIKNMPEVIFVFLCGMRMPTYYSHIKQLVEQLKITENVRFIEDYLLPNQVAQILNISDIFVSIPVSDGLPVSVLEGMACKVIPICSKIEANAELQKKGAKIIFTDIESDAVARTLLKVLKGQSQYFADIAEQNYRLVKEKYSWERICEMMEKVYYDAYYKKD